MKKNYIVIIAIFLISNCTNINNCCSNVALSDNVRKFSFNYSVDVESTNGRKLELWLPVPQTNEVQKISSITLDEGGFVCNEHTEEIHRNKYYYCCYKIRVCISNCSIEKSIIIKKIKS